MADSVKEIWWLELQKMLGTIKKINGYNRDVLAVHDEVVPPGQLGELDAIVMDMGRDLSKTSQSGKRTTGLWEAACEVYLDCFIYDEKPGKAVRQIEADLGRLFYRDLYGAGRGYSLNGKAFEVMIVSSDPFGTVVERPNGGTSVILQVHYHSKIDDWTQRS